MFTVIFDGKWISHSVIRIYVSFTNDRTMWNILLVLTATKCSIFVFGEKKKCWALIIDHAVSLSQRKYLHFTDIPHVTPCAFHIWESSSRHYFGFQIRHSIVQTPVSVSFETEAPTPGASRRPSRSRPVLWQAPGLHALHTQPRKELITIGSWNFFPSFLGNWAEGDVHSQKHLKSRCFSMFLSHLYSFSRDVLYTRKRGTILDAGL